MNLMNYFNFFPRPNQELGSCSYCKESLLDGRALKAHSEGGEKHPIHSDCIKAIVNNWKAQCPICRVPINKSSLISLQERCISQIKITAKDGLKGVFIFSFNAIPFDFSKQAMESELISKEVAYTLLGFGCVSFFIANIRVFGESTVLGSCIGGIAGAIAASTLGGAVLIPALVGGAIGSILGSTVDRKSITS